MNGPNYDKLFLSKRLQKGVHDDLIARYCAFYKGVNDEVVEYYESLVSAPTEEVLSHTMEDGNLTVETSSKKSKKSSPSK